MTVRFEEGGAAVDFFAPRDPDPYDEGDLRLRMHVRVRPPFIFEMPRRDEYGLAFNLENSFAQDPSLDCIRAIYTEAEHVLEENSVDSHKGEVFLAGLFTLLEEAREHLFAEAIPEALSPARRFDSGLGSSWFVYARVASDPSGRVEQLTHACPGLMILIEAFDSMKRADVANELIDRVIRGERLPIILRSAVNAWIHSAKPPSADRKLIARQRLFVRLAGTGVPPIVLWDGPPEVLIPEHVPRSKEENAIWYRFMWNVVSHLDECSDWLTPRQSHDLCRFFSRNALDLRARESLFLEPVDFFDAHEGTEELLARFVEATDRRIDHRTDLNRLANELVGAFGGGSRADLKNRLKLYRRSSCDYSFPVSPLSKMLPWQDDEIRIVWLGDAPAVLSESIMMRHCAYGYISEAATGACQLLHVQVNGRGLTARVEKTSDGGYCLMELAGANNRPLNAHERDVVSQRLNWLFDWVAEQ